MSDHVAVLLWDEKCSINQSLQVIQARRQLSIVIANQTYLVINQLIKYRNQKHILYVHIKVPKNRNLWLIQFSPMWSTFHTLTCIEGCVEWDLHEGSYHCEGTGSWFLLPKKSIYFKKKFFFSENIWNLVGIYTYVLIEKLKSSTEHIKYLHFRTTVEFVPLTWLLPFSM